MKMFWKVCVVAVVVTFVAGPVYGAGADARPDNEATAGLLIIAHGAPFPRWNKPVLKLYPQVLKALGTKSPFRAVRIVFMEFAKPTVADGVKELEAAGCDRIVAVPLLLAPSSHSHWDIPALLGLYADPEIAATLKEEGAEVVHSKLPITVTETMHNADMLREIILDRLKKLSSKPEEEAVVVLAHGCPIFQRHWNDMLKRTVIYLCGKTGITRGDWALVHVGQSYAHEGVPVIASAAGERKRVLVVGLYIGMGVDRMHQRYMNKPASPMFPNPLKGKNVVCAKEGLLPDKRVAKWIARTAVEALGN